MESITTLRKEMRACTECAGHLPFAPNPIFTIDAAARILIIGQAPGRRVHASGVPWDDASGNNLRAWLGISREDFYRPELVALLPMGFCYPGSAKSGSGDAPPRPECAPLWHQRALAAMPHVRLTLLVGNYAQKYHLNANAGATLTETVRNFRSYLPRYFPLPHPSPRNNIWQRKNSWFASEVLPALQKQVARILER